MKKQLLLLLLLLLPMVANADAVEIDGIYYYLTTEKLTAEVTRNPDYYTGSIVIPEKIEYEGMEYSVTSIGYEAFCSCSGLTSISIPNSVTRIRSGAFKSCM